MHDIHRSIERALVDYFEAMETDFRRPADGQFELQLGCDSITLRVNLQIAPESPGLLAFSTLPVTVPGSRRAALRIALNHLNAGMFRGSWILCPTSHCIQIRMFAEIGRVEDAVDGMKSVVAATVRMVESAVGRLFAVAFGNEDPVAAADAIMAGPDERSSDDALPAPRDIGWN